MKQFNARFAFPSQWCQNISTILACLLQVLVKMWKEAQRMQIGKVPGRWEEKGREDSHTSPDHRESSCLVWVLTKGVCLSLSKWCVCPQSRAPHISISTVEFWPSNCNWISYRTWHGPDPTPCEVHGQTPTNVNEHWVVPTDARIKIKSSQWMCEKPKEGSTGVKWWLVKITEFSQPGKPIVIHCLGCATQPPPVTGAEDRSHTTATDWSQSFSWVIEDLDSRVWSSNPCDNP